MGMRARLKPPCAAWMRVALMDASMPLRYLNQWS